MTTSPTLEPIPPRRRGVAWLWFAYVGFIFIDPVFDPSVHLWVITLAAVATFAVIFTAYTRCDEDETSPRRYWLIAATFVLGLLVFPFNGGASTFFIYTAAFLPFTISSTRRVLLLFLAEAALIAVEGLFFRQHLSFVGAGVHIGWPNVFIAVFLLLVIGGANIFFAEQKRYTVAQLRSARELRDAQDQNLALAAVAERERIARDLHDVLGHTLSVITLKAELAGRLLNSETARDLPRAAAEIADVERLARTSLSEVREAITGYRSRGLSAEIEAARRTLDAAGVTLHLADSSSETSRSIPSLTPDEETILSLALREAVTNIVRHARATHCALRFTTDSGTRHLIIEDNGQSPAPPREGNGLRGMRARIESIGGKLALESDHGTRLLITLPSS